MFSKVLLVSSFISVAFATLDVSQPVASTTYSGGDTGHALVMWHEGDADPPLAAFGPTKISIYTGNAQQQTSLQLITANLDVTTTSTLNFTVDPTIGPDSSHYFIRFESLNGKNGSVPWEAFSAQFTLTNMTGVFSASVSAEIAGLSTAPLVSAMPTATGTSTPSSTTSLASTHSSSTPSATSTSKSGAISIKAGWAGLVFGAIVGATMF